MIVTVFPGSKLPVCKKKIGNGCLDIFKHYKKPSRTIARRKMKMFSSQRGYLQKKGTITEKLCDIVIQIYGSPKISIFCYTS
jgi:hypothetical protein